MKGLAACAGSPLNFPPLGRLELTEDNGPSRASLNAMAFNLWMVLTMVTSDERASGCTKVAATVAPRSRA